jgi:tripartite-type tricarboxylate transporter receptor subunit TctC
MIEVGLPQVEVNQWYGAVAPPGLPESIAAKLGGAIIEAMRSAEVKTKLAPLGAVIIASTPDQFADYVKVEIDKWAKAIATSGLKAK